MTHFDMTRATESQLDEWATFRPIDVRAERQRRAREKLFWSDSTRIKNKIRTMTLWRSRNPFTEDELAKGLDVSENDLLIRYRDRVRELDQNIEWGRHLDLREG